MWRHHRECFSLGGRDVLDFWWPHCWRSYFWIQVSESFPVTSLHSKTNKSRFCECFCNTILRLKRSQSSKWERFRECFEIFLRLNKTADLHPSSQIFVNRHLTLCYTVELYRKFWAISGHQNGWNICQKQAEASILQNCQSFITFLCIKVLSHYCSLGTKKLLTGKLTLSIGKKSIFFFPLMMSHHAETRGIYLFAQYTAIKTSFSDVDQPV